MSKGSKAKELVGYSFLVVFANDSTIDLAELLMMEKPALENRQVDEQERGVLHRIFSRADKATVAEAVWDELNRFRQAQNI